MADARNTGKLVTVYGLASSKDGRIRYVGQTVRSLATRLAHHKWRARTEKNRRGAWIRSVLRSGHRIVIFGVEREAVPHLAEIRLIAWYRRHGADLVNATDGGMGSLGFRKSAAEVERLRALHSGKPKSAEHRAKISVALRGKPKSATAVANNAAAQRGRPGHPVSEEAKRKISAANRGRSKPWLAEMNRRREWTPEQRAKIAAARRSKRAK